MPSDEGQNSILCGADPSHGPMKMNYDFWPQDDWYSCETCNYSIMEYEVKANA